MRSAAALGLVAPAAAWWAGGHMLTASVAWNSGIMSDATKAKVNDLITDSSMHEYTQSPDFITAACWADDLKTLGAPQEANWHFIDIPVIAKGYTGTPAPVPTADNNPWAITAGHSTVYSKYSTYLDKARQLRFLIHLVGDIHQPLHAAAYFSDQFPNGDAGGNLWPVAGVDYTNELHAVWDSGAGQWVDDLVRPLNTSGQAWMSSMTNMVMNKWPVSTLQPYINQYNVTLWANQSNDIAASFVYTAPQAPTPLPADYISQAQEIAIKQIAIGGYRLADLLEYIFTTSPAWSEAASQAKASGHEVARAGAKGAAVPAPGPSARLRAGRN